MGSNLPISCQSPLPVFLSITTIPVEDRLGLSRLSRAVHCLQTTLVSDILACAILQASLQPLNLYSFCVTGNMHRRAACIVRLVTPKLVIPGPLWQNLMRKCLPFVCILYRGLSCQVDSPYKYSSTLTLCYALNHLAEQRVSSPSLCSMLDSKHVATQRAQAIPYPMSAPAKLETADFPSNKPPSNRLCRFHAY